MFDTAVNVTLFPVSVRVQCPTARCGIDKHISEPQWNTLLPMERKKSSPVQEDPSAPGKLRFLEGGNRSLILRQRFYV